ncbi:MAG: pyrroloquinoline quinone-dependent dehydrogenase [Planctomycetota bacterium]|nr:MAG: pyrroloquinoline quinone-dependent dehydrogenase [Planctomycetota bacterium]
MRDVLSDTRSAADSETADWPSYGRDVGGTRHSPLTAIDRDNVDRLEVAWVYRTGDVSDGEGDFGTVSAFEATPLLVDGTLYFSTPFNRVIALDPSTGEEKWAFDPQIDLTAHYANQLTSRGVSFWRDKSSPDDPAAHRIFAATNDARLIALNAETGERCADFGSQGEVDLDEGVGKPKYRGEYQVTSPPAIAGDLVIVGSAVSDNVRVDAPSGVIRAYDARDGSLSWSWDLSPPDGPADKDLVTDAGYGLATPNVWAVMSVDEERDLLFVPTGNPSPDYYGGMRNGNDYYGSSVVALRASTGEVVWHFQTVHHDLWDFDVPAQPTLTHVVRDGKQVPVVIQTTKMGLIFTLHRETGEPVFEIEERPVPQSNVPGEKTSPTQPFPVEPPPLVRTTLAPDDGWGPLGLGQEDARKAIAACHFEGMYTPPRVNEPTLMYPGNAGGSNWGGVAVDANRQILIANVIDAPWEVTLFPAEDLEKVRKENPGTEIGRQEGAPYGMKRRLLVSPMELPCNSPPWGTMAAVDLSSGDILWQQPLGTVRDLAPVPLPIHYGTPNLGGPMLTASGLIFIGAAMDNYVRAFDIDTGAELWKRRLPAGGQATPMTYRLSEDSPQMVVIAAGGHGNMTSKLGDYLVAFAPRSTRTIYALWIAETLLALLVVFSLGRFVFPYSRRDDNGVPMASGARRFFGGLWRLILLLAAVGLVLPALLPTQHWLLPAGATVLAAGLACAALANLLFFRPASFVVAGLLLAVTCGVAYWELGELYWIGVLPC